MNQQIPHTARNWWRRWLVMRRVRWILWFFGILALLGLLSPLLSSDLPIRCNFQGQTRYPLFQSGTVMPVRLDNGDTIRQAVHRIHWEQLETERVWWTLIPYGDRARQSHQAISPLGVQQMRNGEALSLRNRHWLGTTQEGRDMLALMLRGIRVSLGVGFLATLLAGLIGFTVGSIAGYFGDDRLRLPSGAGWMMLGTILLAFWLGFGRKTVALEHAEGWAWWGEWASGLVLFLIVSGGILWPLYKWRWTNSNRKKPVRVDFWLSRFIEVLDSLPQLLLIIALGAVLSRDIWTFILLIGFTSWSGVARLVRAESLRVRNADYITSARIAGLPSRRILTHHVWPIVLPALLIPLAFGVGNVMIAESSLSFLNIIENSGSWGAILSAAYNVRQLWWMPLFPGLAIFTVVLAVNVLGESLRKAISGN